MKNRPCPFCGSTNLSIESLKSAWGCDNKEMHIVCNDCAASAPVYVWDPDNTVFTPSAKGLTHKSYDKK